VWSSCTRWSRPWVATSRMKMSAVVARFYCPMPRRASRAKFCTSTPVITLWARRGGCWKSSSRKSNDSGASLHCVDSMEEITEQPTLVAIAVVEHGERFLVGIRPEGKPLAGFAEFPGGKVNDGETPEAAAIRECDEESGLRIEVVS